MLVQAASAEHKYVLCLDDDVTVHPHSLLMLVQALEADDSSFMATGAQSAAYCHSQLCRHSLSQDHLMSSISHATD